MMTLSSRCNSNFINNSILLSDDQIKYKNSTTGSKNVKHSSLELFEANSTSLCKNSKSEK